MTDVVILVTIVAVVYGLVATTSRLFSGVRYASLVIDTTLGEMPWYVAQSGTRMLGGYAVSLLFSLAYDHLAYRVKFAATIIILAVEVLQGIPLFSFLPGVVCCLGAVFRDALVGVELAPVLLLATAMAWNMLLGFYQTLCGLPSDLTYVSCAFHMYAWKRFWTLEMP